MANPVGHARAAVVIVAAPARFTAASVPSGRVGGHKLAAGPYRLETGAPSARFRVTR
jgi:hypothetical protein